MSDPQALPALPPHLKALTVPTGVHNRWPTIAVFGPWKSGKSTMLASFPPPLVAIDAHDQGIGMYLPKDDPRYVCIETTDPGRVNEIVDWAIANESSINSLIIDPATMLWKDHMDAYQELLGIDEIKGGQWKDVKGPWNRRFLKLRRASFYKGYAFRIQDIKYESEAAGPGETGRLVIKASEVPDWEKNMGYLMDQVFETRNVKDSKGKPTPIFEVQFWGGRRPLSITPQELPIGKIWKFDSRKPENVWDKIIVPHLTQYEQDALVHYGVDPETAEKAIAAMQRDLEDGKVGQLLREIQDFQGTSAEYRDFFKRIQMESATLPASAKARVKAAHETKKQEVGG